MAYLYAFQYIFEQYILFVIDLFTQLLTEKR